MVISGGEGDEIVVTGLSGRLPESENIEEFAQQLFNGVDLVTADDRRWPKGLHGLPERNGKLKNIEHFDASFFGVHAKQAHVMDPQIRLLQEVTYEAIVDAGYHPSELRGSRTGVFVGVGASETEDVWNADPNQINGYTVLGCNRAMFSNRISYTFDLRGPSYSIDSACSSSLYALVQAVKSICSGQCDAAIVAGTTLCLKPESSLNFHRLSMLSQEGRCAAFDESASGFVRSEAVVGIFLQKRNVARRVYCTVRGAGMNTDGSKIEGITFPSGDMQYNLAKQTVEQAGIRPEDVQYVEAHGTGTEVGDPQEICAIAKLFCQNRKQPLLVGSVKSNMGHSESASGLCSVIKVVLAMERGIIPANLHYKTPNKNIPALSDGRIKVVDTNTAWAGGLVAINSFGFGGTNAHVILESECERKIDSAKVCGSETDCESTLPRLVMVSGRTEAATRELLALAEKNRHNPNLLALLNAVHAYATPLHPHRGYCLLSQPVQQELFEVDHETRPIWFVFSGMGSQWLGMGRSLLDLPVFASSLERSAEALKPHGIDLKQILFEATDDARDDLVSANVSIAAVQVALVDVLYSMGIYPDGIVGHSIGEIGCAYADGALTAEQTVLAAYWRARSVLDANVEGGAMAAVGLSWEQCLSRCPPDVTVACHNAVDNVTISGPLESIEKMVTELSAENVFVKLVNSSGLAFHSPYIEAAAPLLRRRLERIIPEPKSRSAKWLSTSLPPDQWNSELAKFNDASYHVNNLLSPVRFVEALKNVPSNALLVELAPHALLQPLLRRARPAPAVTVPLLRRDAPDATLHLLSALGKLYGAGALPRLDKLYPPAAWPVPRGTPGLASHVKWDHSTVWDVARFGTARSAENIIEYDLSKEEHSYLSGHVINGRILFPATGYLEMVWKTMAKLHNKTMEETAIVIENVQLKRAIVMSSEGPVRFLISVFHGSGEFEVCESGSVVATGRVRLAADAAAERLSWDTPSSTEPDLLPFQSEDIYNNLRLRGYQYTGDFVGIRVADLRTNVGEVVWKNNWVTFMDTMLQFTIIAKNTHNLYIPTRIRRIFIDPKSHAAASAHTNGTLPVYAHRDINIVSSGGVEIRGPKLNLLPRRSNSQETPVYEKYIFIPYHNVNTSITNKITLSKQDAIAVILQILMENTGTMDLKIMEAALDRPSETLLLPSIIELLKVQPQVRLEDATLAIGSRTAPYAFITQQHSIKVSSQTWNPEWHLVVAAAACVRRGILRALTSAMKEGGMLLLEEPCGTYESMSSELRSAGLAVVARQAVADCEYLLLRRAALLPITKVVIELDDESYCWVEPLRDALKRAESEPIRVYAISYSRSSGALGLARCLRIEPGGYALRYFHLHNASEKFDVDAPMYAEQVALDLVVNVLKEKTWGCHRHLPLPVAATRQVEHAFVNTLTRGDLSSLNWIESDLSQAKSLASNTLLCHVNCSALNFRDVMLATGKLPPDALPRHIAEQECLLGFEFSGRSPTGTRVMGIVSARGLATTVLADIGFLWDVPKTWSMEQASTVPVAYATAYYALCVRGRMRRGESVLIHAGAGGVGQAAIAVALAAGCGVFTTVGTPDKRAFLLRRFPNLPPENIANSRDTSFEQQVLIRTEGRGVDLVLNSLADEKLHASMRCLADGGRFLEIGKYDLSQDTPLGMSVFLNNTTFHGIFLDNFFDVKNSNEEKREIVRLVSEGIASGVVQPLPSTVYTEDQLEQAFRYMATGQHIGKVVVRIREEEDSAAKIVTAIPRVYLNPNKSYVVVGGLGGVGLEMSNWLVSRGATTLVLNSRSGVRTGYQGWCVRRWRECGVKVCVSTADASTADGSRTLLREAATLAPVGGVFNLAAVLRDAFLENLTPDDFRAVARPKIDVTRRLDEATRELALQLDYFVVFSSVACGRGNSAQSNYGFANSAMERIVENRQADGLTGLAVQWGTIGDVGVAVNMSGYEETISIVGTKPQPVASCMESLDVLLRQPHAVTTCMVLADKNRVPVAPVKDLTLIVANILGIKELANVSESMSLAELGMDSLMSAEIKQTLERGYDVVLTAQEIRALTLSRLRALAGAVDEAANDVSQ